MAGDGHERRHGLAACRDDFAQMLSAEAEPAEFRGDHDRLEIDGVRKKPPRGIAHDRLALAEYNALEVRVREGAGKALPASPKGRREAQFMKIEGRVKERMFGRCEKFIPHAKGPAEDFLQHDRVKSL